jgi:hypothetical protein
MFWLPSRWKKACFIDTARLSALSVSSMTKSVRCVPIKAHKLFYGVAPGRDDLSICACQRSPRRWSLIASGFVGRSRQPIVHDRRRKERQERDFYRGAPWDYGSNLILFHNQPDQIPIVGFVLTDRLTPASDWRFPGQMTAIFVHKARWRLKHIHGLWEQGCHRTVFETPVDRAIQIHQNKRSTLFTLPSLP